MALSQLKTICEGLNNTNFEDERGGRRRRGSNKKILELGTRYADVVVANQRTIPTLKAFSRKVKAPPREQLVQCPTTAMAVFYSNLEGYQLVDDMHHSYSMPTLSTRSSPRSAICRLANPCHESPIKVLGVKSSFANTPFSPFQY
jgi:hypothetical protein